MPRLAIDYSKTIIYRIICKNPTITDCYVGSTTDFKSRKKNHKTCCNNKNSKDYNLNVYTFIRDNNGWDNWDMIEIEKYKAIDQPDQAKRERYWLEFYSATLNSQVPSQTNEEYFKKYRETHKEQIKEQQKECNTEYYIINKTQIKEQRKEFYEQNKERLLEEKKEYYNKNKERLLEYKKIYCEKNKEKIKEKMTCNCGSICRKSDISKHIKSKKHQSFLLNISSNNLCA